MDNPDKIRTGPIDIQTTDWMKTYPLNVKDCPFCCFLKLYKIQGIWTVQISDNVIFGLLISRSFLKWAVLNKTRWPLQLHGHWARQTVWEWVADFSTALFILLPLLDSTAGLPPTVWGYSIAATWATAILLPVAVE